MPIKLSVDKVAACFYAFFLLTVVLQLTRSVYVDIYSIGFGTIHVLLNQVLVLTSTLLVLWGMHKNSVYVFPTIFLLLFLVYAALVVQVTSDYSVVDFLLARDGLFLWSVIGSGCGIAISFFQDFFVGNKSISLNTVSRIMVFVMPLPLIFILIEYFNAPQPTLSYQGATDSAIILFSLVLFLYVLFWGKSKSVITHTIIFSQFTFCVAILAMTGSNMIIAFWAVVVVTLFGTLITALSLKKLMIFLMSIVICFIYIFNSPIFDVLEAYTRLDGLKDSSMSFSSISSRIEMMSLFPEQFNVSPIFGHFRAQVVAGHSIATYAHSIPLSLLSHTGLLGFGLTSLIVFLLLFPRMRSLTYTDSYILRLALGVLALGSMYAFFTWVPFWFLLGLLISHPAKLSAGGRIDFGVEKKGSYRSIEVKRLNKQHT